MDFYNGIVKAYKTKWSYINTFTVKFEFAQAISNFIGWKNEEDINIHIVSINTPEFTHQPVEAFIGNRWRIHSGRDEMYNFEITFRDRDQMILYKKFLTAYFFQKYNYFDDSKMQISLYKDADYVGETLNKLFDFRDVIIASVSQLQFNNSTESQIAEFSVQFRCATPIPNIDNIKGNTNQLGF